MGRIPALAAVRALAAALVLVSHVGFWTGFTATGFLGVAAARGDVGVAIFFALTAFLLLRPWLAGAPSDLRTYAVRRVGRILPAYWVVLGLVLLVAWRRPGATGGVEGAAKVAEHAALVQGLTGSSYQAFSQTWSLTTELTFYAVVPVLGAALLRAGARLGRPLMAAALAGLIVQGLAIVWVRADPSGYGGVLATSVLGHAAWFAVGLGVAVHRLRAGSARGIATPPAWPPVVGSSPGSALALAGFLYLLICTPLGGPRVLSAPTPAAAIGKEAVYAAIAGLVLLAATAPVTSSRVLGLIARSRLSAFLGDISYGVFLTHVLALQVVFLVVGWRPFDAPVGPVTTGVLGLTIGASTILFYVIERPIIRATHRR